MPWDAGSALDRLGTSVRGLADLRQRKKEANRALLMQMLGQGVDIWKTVTGPKREEEAALMKWGPEGSGKAEIGVRTGAELELMGKSHEYELGKIAATMVGQKELEQLKQNGDLDRLNAEYGLRLSELAKVQGFEDAQRIAKQEWEEKLKNAAMAFEAGESTKDRAANLANIAAQGAQTRLTQADKGVSGDLNSQFWDMWSRVKGMNPQWFDGEEARPEFINTIKDAMRAAIVTNDAAERTWFMAQIDAWNGAPTADATPIKPPPYSAVQPRVANPSRPAAPPAGSSQRAPVVDNAIQQRKLEELWEMIAAVKGAQGDRGLVNDMSSAATDLGSGRVFTKEQMDAIQLLLDRAKAYLNPTAVEPRRAAELLGLPEMP